MNRNIQTLLSIHDVMPHTLSRATDIVALLRRNGYHAISLLVVPGCGWSQQQLYTLQKMQSQGIEIVGHGWHHKARSINGLKHKLHSLFVSKAVAEHLCLTEPEIQELLARSYNWFCDHDFAPPQTYVPPAWAMGHIDRHKLASSGFRYFEYMTGIYDSKTDTFRIIPLVGFEADSQFRGICVKMSNQINLLLTKKAQLLRLSIHPFDFEFTLSKHLQQVLARPIQAVLLADLDRRMLVA